jgi:hypothetical protein
MDDVSVVRDHDEQGSDDAITPELIREIADKVYVLLVRRLQIERERDRLGTNYEQGW